VRVGVLAVGNRFAGDDGVGPFVLDAVRDELPANVVARELDGEPARLLDAWDGLDAVVLVDAACSGAPVGTVHRVVAVAASGPPPARPADGTPVGLALPATPRSTHGAGVTEALGLGRMLGRLPAEVVVIGVEGTRFSPGAGLSHEVSDALPAAIRAVRDEVRRLVAVPA
jgi:hydrogenase maturation protease